VVLVAPSTAEVQVASPTVVVGALVVVTRLDTTAAEAALTSSGCSARPPVGLGDDHQGQLSSGGRMDRHRNGDRCLVHLLETRPSSCR
jgi:hypothetical protein